MMPVRVVSFKIEADLLDLIERIAREKGMTKSELIRQAIKKYIFEDKENQRIIVTRRMRIYL